MVLTPKADSRGSSKGDQQCHLWAKARDVKSDHSSQVRRKKESHGPQEADNDKQPKEYPINDHGHILPVFLYLQMK